jgi:hypothetical protein
MNIICPFCENVFDVVPRADGWSGNFRVHFNCPHCSNQYLWKDLPQGPKRDQEPVEAFLIDTSTPVLIQEYDGTIDNAKTFATHVRRAWERLPKIAQVTMTDHWRMHTGAPFIWLLSDRKEWGGGGWAGTLRPASLFVVDQVASHLPSEHLESLLVHEFCHLLFIAVGDEHHCTMTGEDRPLRCEKLVWDVTATWGVDITDTELWMKRHFIDTEDELRPRESPLPLKETKHECDEARALILCRMAQFDFPHKYSKFKKAIS